MCDAKLKECTKTCGDALCQRVAGTCHDAASGGPELAECHDVGHDGDADTCFERGAGCLELCREH
jgi:hypothetical protein